MRRPGAVLVAFLFVVAGCEGAGGVPTPSTPPVLSESELNRLSLEAMAGNIEAVDQVMDYYRFIWLSEDGSWQPDREWALIGAENGSRMGVQAVEVYMSALLAVEHSREIPRSVFWRRVAAKRGDEYGEFVKHGLEGEGLSLEFDFPPDDSFPDSYTDMTAEMIGSCEESALNGSGKAARLLAQYYFNTLKNADLSEYWYRIGAQNGDPECQYKLGDIYWRNSGTLNRTRSTFWRNKAVENGYVAP